MEPNNTLVMDGDVKVNIVRIMQWKTYADLLEGLPNRRLNANLVRHLEEKLQAFCGFDEIYIIRPEEKPIVVNGPYFRGEPALLPAVTCMAEVHTSGTYKDGTKAFSMMGIGWFQENFAFPVDEHILRQIKSIPYRELCGEYVGLAV